MLTRYITLLLLVIVPLMAPAASGDYADGKANYLPLDPALVVNLHSGKRMRFMQIKIQMMSRDTAVIAALQESNGYLEILSMERLEKSPKLVEFLYLP